MDSPTRTLFLAQIGLILAHPYAWRRSWKKLAIWPLVLELLCGVMLGPSLFGVVAPELCYQIFPAAALIIKARATSMLSAVGIKRVMRIPA